MKKVFIADDGTHFDTAHECVAYEERQHVSEKVMDFIGSQMLDVLLTHEQVADFIVANFVTLTELCNLGTIEDPSMKWIPNSNNFNDYAPVPGETEIEVEYRNGFKETGNASEWSASWCSIDGAHNDIVAYRILKSHD